MTRSNGTAICDQCGRMVFYKTHTNLSTTTSDDSSDAWLGGCLLGLLGLGLLSDTENEGCLFTLIRKILKSLLFIVLLLLAIIVLAVVCFIVFTIK